MRVWVAVNSDRWVTATTVFKRVLAKWTVVP